MGVAVYPRLSDLLRARNLTVAELERQIKQQFGVSVDPKTLYRLTHTDPVQRADLEIAGAAAAVLGVGLDDIFDVEAIPVASDGYTAVSELDPEQSQRLAELFDRQARSSLSGAERQQLERLVGEFGRRLHERRLREIAEQRGITVDQARREVAAQLDEALEWWRTFDADPSRRRSIAVRARRRHSGSAE